MKAKFSLLLAIVLVLGNSSVFAATSANVETSGASVKVDSKDKASVSTKDASVKPDADTDSLDASDLPSEDASDETGSGDVSLNAASGKEVVVAPKGGISNYVEVACDKDYFTQNSCNQCFEGGKKAVGEKVTGLTDSWTNPNSSEQIIYKDEQTMPELVNVGGANTVWLTNPQESDKFWKFSDEIVWTDSSTGSGKQEFLLEGGKTVNFLESDLGASYALQSSDKKEGEPVGLLKFAINYHDTDASANEGQKKLHTECVAYYASTPVVQKPTPVPPKEVTKVKTGPESYALILVALLLSLGLMKYRKRA